MQIRSVGIDLGKTTARRSTSPQKAGYIDADFLPPNFSLAARRRTIYLGSCRSGQVAGLKLPRTPLMRSPFSRDFDIAIGLPVAGITTSISYD